MSVIGLVYKCTLHDIVSKGFRHLFRSKVLFLEDGVFDESLLVNCHVAQTTSEPDYNRSSCNGT